MSLLLALLLQAVPPAPIDSYTVGVVGDNQNGPTTFSAICQRMAAEPITLFVGLGDHVQNGLPSEWVSQWQTPLTPIAGIPRMGAIGNHDDVPGYLANVWPSQQHALSHPIYGNAIALWTAVTIGPVRWVFLDTNEHPTIRISLEPGGAQRVWLEQELVSQAWLTARWRIVAFHHPSRTEYWDGGCYYHALAEREALVQLLPLGGCHLVLNGHAHAYQRGTLVARPSPVWVVSGGGGGWLDTTHCWDWPEITVAQATHHWLRLSITPTALTVEAVTPAGLTFDTVVIP